MGVMNSPFVGYFRRPKKLSGFSGVASGGLAKLRFAGGTLLHEICLVTNATYAQITYVELLKNGNTLVKLSGTQLVFLENYKKHYVEAGRFFIPLADVFMTSLEGEILSGLATTTDDEIEVNVQFGVVTTPTLTAEIIESAYDPAQAATLWEPRIRYVTLDGGPAGSNKAIENAHETKDGSEVMRRLHLDGSSSDYISSLKMERDDVLLHEESTLTSRLRLKRLGLAPQAGWYHMDFVAYGFAVEAFSTAHARSLKFTPTFSTALSDTNAIIETLRRVA